MNQRSPALTFTLAFYFTFNSQSVNKQAPLLNLKYFVNKCNNITDSRLENKSLKLIMKFNCFSPLHFALSLSGLHLLPNNLWIKIFNWTCFLLTVFGSLCVLSELRYYSFNIFTRELVSVLIWNTDVVNNFIFIFVILKNRKHLDSILKQILPFLSQKDKRCLWKLSITGCTCSVLFTIHIIAMYLAYYFVHKPTKEDNDQGSSYTLFETMFHILAEKDCISVSGRFMYCFYIRIISLQEKQFLQRVEKQCKILTPGNVSSQLRKLYVFKNFVQDKFSILPVIWFLKEIIFTLGPVLTQQQSWSKRNPTFYWLMNIVPPVHSLLVHIFLVCYVDHCKKDVDAQIDRLTQSLALEDYDKWQMVINELDRAKGFNYTADNLFDVNKRTGLSFISVMITLTVLLEQLLSKLPVE